MRHGEIWWAALGTPRGSEPGFRRPVLIVQANEFTESRIRTVLAAAVTSNTRLASAPGNVLVRRKESNLRKDSVVNVSQIVTLNKSALMERVGLLPSRLRAKVDEGLRLVLAL